MKKIISMLMVLALCLSLGACSSFGGNEKAFNDSKEAFGCVTEAYLATNEFSQDIYEAWRLGVNDRKSYDNEREMSSLAAELNISLSDLKKGVASLLDKANYEYGDWEDLPYLYGGSYFSAWVSAVAEAYKCNGEADEIKENLTKAKDLMKQLSNDYADYEHYPSLKKYFTNTLAFFDFCCDPEGSFEQVVNTFNNYRNNAREYFFDLNYVFGDSIGGMNDYTATEPEATEGSNSDSTQKTTPNAEAPAEH